MINCKLKSLFVLTLTFSLFGSACTQSNTPSTTSTSSNTATVSPPSATSTDAQSVSQPVAASVPAVTPTTPSSATPITTNPSLPNPSPNPKAAGTSPPATVSSSGAQDFFVFTAVRGALNNDAELMKENITVDVKSGVVILTGSVTGKEKLARALQIAGQAKDAKGVKNLLKVVPAK